MTIHNNCQRTGYTFSQRFNLLNKCLLSSYVILKPEAKWNSNGSSNPNYKTGSGSHKEKEKSYHIVDFTLSIDHRWLLSQFLEWFRRSLFWRNWKLWEKNWNYPDIPTENILSTEECPGVEIYCNAISSVSYQLHVQFKIPFASIAQTWLWLGHPQKRIVIDFISVLSTLCVLWPAVTRIRIKISKAANHLTKK